MVPSRPFLIHNPTVALPLTLFPPPPGYQQGPPPPANQRRHHVHRHSVNSNPSSVMVSSSNTNNHPLPPYINHLPAPPLSRNVIPQQPSPLPLPPNHHPPPPPHQSLSSSSPWLAPPPTSDSSSSASSSNSSSHAAAAPPPPSSSYRHHQERCIRKHPISGGSCSSTVYQRHKTLNNKNFPFQQTTAPSLSPSQNHNNVGFISNVTPWPTTNTIPTNNSNISSNIQNSYPQNAPNPCNNNNNQTAATQSASIYYHYPPLPSHPPPPPTLPLLGPIDNVEHTGGGTSIDHGSLSSLAPNMSNSVINNVTAYDTNFTNSSNSGNFHHFSENCYSKNNTSVDFKERSQSTRYMGEIRSGASSSSLVLPYKSYQHESDPCSSSPSSQSLSSAAYPHVFPMNWSNNNDNNTSQQQQQQQQASLGLNYDPHHMANHVPTNLTLLQGLPPPPPPLSPLVQSQNINTGIETDVPNEEEVEVDSTLLVDIDNITTPHQPLLDPTTSNNNNPPSSTFLTTKQQKPRDHVYDFWSSRIQIRHNYNITGLVGNNNNLSINTSHHYDDILQNGTMIVLKLSLLDLSSNSQQLNEFIYTFLPHYGEAVKLQKLLSASEAKSSNNVQENDNNNTIDLISRRIPAEIFLHQSQLDSLSLQRLLEAFDRYSLLPTALHLGSNPELGSSGIHVLADFIRNKSILPLRWIALSKCGATHIYSRSSTTLPINDTMNNILSSSCNNKNNSNSVAPVWLDFGIGTDEAFSGKNDNEDIFTYLDHLEPNLYCRATNRLSCGINRCGTSGAIFHIPKLNSQNIIMNKNENRFFQSNSNILNRSSSSSSSSTSSFKGDKQVLLMNPISSSLKTTPMNPLCNDIINQEDYEDQLSVVSSENGKDEDDFDDEETILSEISSEEEEEDDEDFTTTYNNNNNNHLISEVSPDCTSPVGFQNETFENTRLVHNLPEQELYMNQLKDSRNEFRHDKNETMLLSPNNNNTSPLTTTYDYSKRCRHRNDNDSLTHLSNNNNDVSFLVDDTRSHHTSYNKYTSSPLNKTSSSYHHHHHRSRISSSRSGKKPYIQFDEHEIPSSSSLFPDHHNVFQQHHHYHSPISKETHYSNPLHTSLTKIYYCLLRDTFLSLGLLAANHEILPIDFLKDLNALFVKNLSLNSIDLPPLWALQPTQLLAEKLLEKRESKKHLLPTFSIEKDHTNNNHYYYEENMDEHHHHHYDDIQNNNRLQEKKRRRSSSGGSNSSSYDGDLNYCEMDYEITSAAKTTALQQKDSILEEGEEYNNNNDYHHNHLDDNNRTNRGGHNSSSLSTRLSITKKKQVISNNFQETPLLNKETNFIIDQNNKIAAAAAAAADDSCCSVDTADDDEPITTDDIQTNQQHFLESSYKHITTKNNNVELSNNNTSHDLRKKQQQEGYLIIHSTNIINDNNKEDIDIEVDDEKGLNNQEAIITTKDKEDNNNNTSVITEHSQVTINNNNISLPSDTESLEIVNQEEQRLLSSSNLCSDDNNKLKKNINDIESCDVEEGEIAAALTYTTDSYHQTPLKKPNGIVYNQGENLTLRLLPWQKGSNTTRI